MSQANIPNITPSITITVEDTIKLLFASIALEELALAHIVNAEAEKIQYVLGTLEGNTLTPPATVSQILLVNEAVRKTLGDVLKKELLLESKLDSILSHFPVPLE